MFAWVVKYLHFLSKVPLLPHFYNSLLLLQNFVFRRDKFEWICKFEERIKQMEGVSLSLHSYGGLQFNIGSKELGHMHGNALLDVYVGVKQRDYCITHFACAQHHVLEHSGAWVSLWMKEEKDFHAAVALLEFAYEQHRK